MQEEKKDILSPFFKNCSKELPTLLLHDLCSEAPVLKSFKNVCSLACTSHIFNDFMLNKNISIDLITYIHTLYPSVSREEMIPLLLFLNTEVARYYYYKGSLVNREKDSPNEIFNTIFSGFSNAKVSVPVEDLFSAIEDEKKLKIRLYARFGASFYDSMVYENGLLSSVPLTALRAAVSTGNMDIIKLCIELGKMATDASSFYEILAPQYPEYTKELKPENQLELVKFFVSLGATINGRGFFTAKTPLHMAVQEGNSTLARFLVSKGAAVNPCDLLLNTPLDVAYNNIHRPLLPLNDLIRLCSSVTVLICYNGPELPARVDEKAIQTLVLVDALYQILSPLQKKLEKAFLYSLSQGTLNKLLYSLDGLGDHMVRKLQQYVDTDIQKDIENKTIIKALEKNGGSAAPYINYGTYENNEKVKFLLYTSFKTIKFYMMLYLFTSFISFVCGDHTHNLS